MVQLRMAVKKVDCNFPNKIHSKARKIKKYLNNTLVSNNILSTLGVTLIQPKQEPLFFCQRVQIKLCIETT